MPTLLVVDDDRSVRMMVSEAFRDGDFQVHTTSSANEAKDFLMANADDVGAILLDIMLPDMSGLEAIAMYLGIDRRIPIVFITSHGSSEVAIEAMTKGAYDYLLKPLDLRQLRDVVGRAVEIRRKMAVRVGVAEEGDGDESMDTIVGASAPMQEVYKGIGRVAGQDVTVLIEGESGTGKELVARAIYQHSARNNAPFLAINCAAVPANLLESELFGHEKGAFTGANTRRIGKFEQCDGGTIFLDEIGDMPGELQSKMLRLLQEQRFERVGGNETISTNVRIIAATNQDLEDMVEEGDFREDLYYRLKGFLICLPPLRKRGDDVVLLSKRLLKKFNRELNKHVERISPEALSVMKQYPWPGNVRELENVIRQAILQATGPVLLPEFLPDIACYDIPSKAAEESASRSDVSEFINGRVSSNSTNLYAETIEYTERILLPIVLKATDGNQSRAAVMLGITRGSLRNKLRNLGITVEQVVSVEADGSDDDDSSDDAK